MDEELISKKDILNLTGISYGQLYRWKRKELIPEDWFIKKSSFTGQETFFPKDKIVERINKILEFKDDMPLDDLAAMFSNRPKIDDMGEDAVLSKSIIKKETFSLYEGIFSRKDRYEFKDALIMYVLQNQIDQEKLTIEEIESVLKLIEREYERLEEKNGTVYVIRRLGVGMCLAAFEERIALDPGVKIVGEINIKSTIDAVKFKLAV